MTDISGISCPGTAQVLTIVAANLCVYRSEVILEPKVNNHFMHAICTEHIVRREEDRKGLSLPVLSS